MMNDSPIEKATFGAGCFWHVEAAFQHINGVCSTTVGYMGGAKKNPSYEDVCTDKTGHAEVLQIEYDPKKISYDDLLNIFWRIHDPTQVNRQGPDVGTQYRSIIFYHSDMQKKIALESLQRQQKNQGKKIATIIQPATEFWSAEEYHQRYFEKHGKACGTSFCPF